MRLITNAGLHRGAALIDYAFFREEEAPGFNASDLIGVVSAYLGRGCYPKHMREEIAELLSPKLAQRAVDTFNLFAVDGPDRDDGFWYRGEAYDDVGFIHPKLGWWYPKINRNCGRVPDFL